MEGEENSRPLAVTHLLQHTLRSVCNDENSQWVYAVFWRILPRNYPPPNTWNDQRRLPSIKREQKKLGLQPELFFKMSYEIYNYGEGTPLYHSLIGKVAAERSHKWIYKEPNDQEIYLLSSCLNSADTPPRTWEEQFQSGIKEGVVQLGATHTVVEDLSLVVFLRKRFNSIESIPGVLFPHPSSPLYPSKVDGFRDLGTWQFHGVAKENPPALYHHLRITPSMSSLEALLSKLPSVVPQSPTSQFIPPRQIELESTENLAEAQSHQPHYHYYVGETSNSISTDNRYENAHSYRQNQQ